MFKLQATHAQTAGADAIACVGPTFFKPDSLGLSPTLLKLHFALFVWHFNIATAYFVAFSDVNCSNSQ